MSRSQTKKGGLWSRNGQNGQKGEDYGLVMLKILQARLQQYVNCELSDVQVGFRKSRGTREQIANILWILKKKRVPEKLLFLLY